MSGCRRMWGTPDHSCAVYAVSYCACSACTAGGRQDLDLVEFRFVEDAQAVLFRCGLGDCDASV